MPTYIMWFDFNKVMRWKPVSASSTWIFLNMLYNNCNLKYSLVCGQLWVILKFFFKILISYYEILLKIFLRIRYLYTDFQPHTRSLKIFLCFTHFLKYATYTYAYHLLLNIIYLSVIYDHVI